MSRRRRNKITIYEYIAERKPADAHFIINKFGKYRRARNSKELSYQLRDFVKTFGEKALRELSKIHPDKELVALECEKCKTHTCKPIIKEVIKEVPTQQITPTPPVYYNASGEQIQRDANEGRIFIFMGFVLLAVAILNKKM